MHRAASPLVILGAGGHGRVVASAARAAGSVVRAFYDDDPRLWGRSVDGVPVLGPTEDLAAAPPSTPAVIAIGDNLTRARISARLDLDWAIVRHPSSSVAPEATLGAGTVLSAGAVVQPGAVVGTHVILNVHAVVDHDAQVGDHAHLSAAHLGARASAGVRVLLGLGSVVLPGVRIGDDAILGAGAVAVADVEPGVTAIGIPARPVTTPTMTALIRSWRQRRVQVAHRSAT